MLRVHRYALYTKSIGKVKKLKRFFIVSEWFYFFVSFNLYIKPYHCDKLEMTTPNRYRYIKNKLEVKIHVNAFTTHSTVKTTTLERH